MFQVKLGKYIYAQKVDIVLALRYDFEEHKYS